MVDLNLNMSTTTVQMNEELQSEEVTIASDTADSSRKTATRGKDTMDLETGSLLAWQEQFQYSVTC